MKISPATKDLCLQVRQCLHALIPCFTETHGLDENSKETPGQPAFHIRFSTTAGWFMITEDHDGSWIILPCNKLGQVVERIGRPEDVCKAAHPDTCPATLAKMAIVTALKWKLPEYLDDPVFCVTRYLD